MSSIITGHVTIGADIEYFLQDKQSKEIITAEGIIQGTKYEPFCFDQNNKFFATSLDNVLAEHCIPPVDLTNKQGFIENILKSQHYIESLNENICLAIQPSARLLDKYLQSETAKTFGCEPDYNCWNGGDANPRPTSAVSNLRTAGFHVHFGYEKPGYDENIEFAKRFDLFVTLPALLIEPENERRLLYGKAGSFRNKPYGLEVRTLSSYFASSPELIGWVFEQSKVVVENINNPMPEFPIEDVINTKNYEFAKEICKQLNINYAIAS